MKRLLGRALRKASSSGRLRLGFLALALLALGGTAFALAGAPVSGFTRADPDAALALAYVKGSPTFLHDGIQGSLRLESRKDMLCPDCYEYTIYFESAHPGYGDRTGLSLTPQVTPHRAKIFVVGHEVVMGVMDGGWDIGRQLVIEQE